MPSVDFSTSDVAVGERRHLRQVGDDQHLGGAGQLGQPAADLDRRCAPTPASTSSKTNVGTGLVPASETSSASITRDSSPPDAPLCERAGLGAGVGGQQELDLVDAGAVTQPRPPTGGSPARTGAPRSRPGVRHRQQGQLGGDLRRRAAPAASVRAADSAAAAAPSSARSASCSARSSLDPLVGGVEVEQPGRGLLGPGEHLVDGVAVLAGERGQRRPALGDGRQPGGVGVDPGGVRRHVGGQVGQQVGDLGEPVGQLAGLGVVLAHAVELAAGGRRPRPARRARPPRWRAPRGPARRRCAGCRRSPAGTPRPPARRPRRGSGPTASISPSPNRSRSASRARSRAVATTSSSSVSAASAGGSRLGVAPPAARPAARRRTGRARRAARAACSSRCWSDWPCTATSGSATSASAATGTDGAAHEGAGAALGGDVAGQDDAVVLDLAARPRSTASARSPARSVDARRRPRPGPVGRRCGPRRCRPGRRAAGRAR